MASGVVTRSPPRNSLAMPSRSSIALICGPPPCTTTGRARRSRRKTMSWAKAALSASSTIALPPYLTTTVAPWNRSSQGSASASTAAFDRGRRTWSAASCRVRRVLVDVVGGQVVGPDRGGRRRPAAGRPRSRTSRPDRSTRSTVLAERAVPAHPDAVDRDVELRRGSKAADVVPTAASTRPQFGSSPWTAHLNRLLRATARATSTASSSVAAPTTSIRDVLARALGVGDQLPGQVGADRLDGRPRTSSAAGATPEAPEASSSTVSLVDMQPSESIRSKVRAVAARSAASSSGRSAGRRRS